jgi:hypothetical protein
VYRSATKGGPYTFLALVPATSPTASYTDYPFTGVTYYYVVTAYNNNGQESVYSNQASATAK